jgi:hypothetical protein
MTLFRKDQKMLKTRAHPRKCVYHTREKMEEREREEEKEKKECDWGVYDPCVYTGS